MTLMEAPVEPFAARPPAVVEPGPPIRRDRLSRYARQLVIPGFGETAQRRLANARVLVVGAGGLGSATVPALAAAGVGTIGVIDPDVVELSNLHRQLVHGMGDIGRRKADSIADAIAAIDPEVIVHRHTVLLDSTNAMRLLSGYDLVVDGSDNFATRYLTNDAAALSHKPLVWGAILGYGGQAGVAFVDHGPTYRDLFPVSPGADDVPSCSIGGVLPSVCAAIGAIMTTETIKLITGIGEPLLGRVTTYDALTGRFREVAYRRIPGADPITALAGREPLSGTRGPTITAAELARRLAAHEPLQLVDVREPAEAAIVSIPGSELIPLGTIEDSLERIRTDVPVVVYCHHGGRAHRAVSLLGDHGLRNVERLDGGIDAFAALLDPAMPRY